MKKRKTALTLFLLVTALITSYPANGASATEGTTSVNLESSEKGKRKNQVALEDVTIPVDSKSYNGKGVTVAVMDSDFLSDNFESSLRNDKLKGRFQQYEEIGNGRGTPNGSNHGYRVARVVGDVSEGVARGVSIVGTSFGVVSNSGVGVQTDTKKYLELFKKRPDIKIFNQSFGMTMDITKYKANIQRQLYRYNPYMNRDDLERYFREYINKTYSHYQQGVNEDRLFVWAAGNTGQRANGGREYFDNPMVEAGMPYYKKELEKGWLSVVGLDLRNPNQPKELENEDRNGHLARAGVAANWTIATDGIMDITYGYGKNKDETVTIAGSSFAAPKVAGVAALLKEKYPWMGANELRQSILTTAKEVEDLYRSTNEYRWVPAGEGYIRREYINERRHLSKEELRNIYGWGILDIDKAMKGPAKFDKSLTGLTDQENRFQAKIEDQNMKSIFANDISGDGGLYKAGKGSLALTGNNTYTGSTLVYQGNLEVYRGLKSDVTIDKEGKLVLSKESRIANVLNKGTLENIGSGAIIQGNYDSKADSLLIADLDSRLKIQGDVNLEEESNLAVVPNSYVSSTGRASSIVEATGEIRGSFQRVLSPLLIQTKVNRDGNTIKLIAQRKNIEAAMAGNGESVENVARSLEKIYQKADAGGLTSSFENSLAELQGTATASSLSRQLSSLSGEVYASAQTLTFQQTQAVNRDLSNRMASLNNLDGQYASSVWLSYLNANGKISQQGYDKANTRLNGGQFGIDTRVTQNSVLGLALNYSQANASFNRYAGKSESKGVGASIYGRYRIMDSLYAQGRIGVSSLSTDVERDVLNTRAKVHHRDTLYSAYAELGYDMKTDSLKLTPFIGFSHDVLRRGAFHENVNQLSISAPKKSYQKDMAIVGLKAQYDIAQAKGQVTHLNAAASVGKNISSRSLDFKASYDGDKTQQVEFKGVKMPDYTLWAGVGVGHEFTKQFSVYANYDIKVENDKIADKVASVGMKYQF